jgi:hypothetical protein
MANKHLLIIEDRVEEQEFARNTANSLGIETKVAKDLQSGLREIQNSPFGIASDLFFPSGNIDQEPYLQQVLPIYESYLKTFKTKTEGPLVEVLKFIFGEVKNKTKEELFEGFIKPQFLRGWQERDVEEVRDAYFGIEFYSRYSGLQKQIESMKQGKDIPYGIFIAKEARRLRIPCYTVTSINHHDIAFEPIKERIGAYSNRINENGHKDWKSGFEYLLDKTIRGKVKK